MMSLFLGLSGLASAGAAQAVPFSSDDTIEATHRFADCVVGRKRGQVIEMLEQVPNTPEETRIARRIGTSSGDCLTQASRGYDVEMRFRPFAIRGYFAEALYSRDFADDGTPKSDTRPLARLPDLLEASRQPDVTELTRTSLILGAFAGCIVESDPARSAHLLKTRPTKSDETAAFEALHPAMGPCYPEGQTLTINRPILRGFIAEGLYRRSAQLAARAEPVQ